MLQHFTYYTLTMLPIWLQSSLLVNFINHKSYPIRQL